MALEDLLVTLEREAREQVAARLAAATADAERAAAEADVQVAARRAEFVAGREAKLREAAELELVAARRDGRRLVLDARADMLQAVKEAARARLEGLETDSRYRGLLPTQLGEALRYLGDRESVVLSSSWLEPILAAAARGRAGARVRAEEAAVDGGGFVLAAADGSVRVDMTLRTILDRLWPELAMVIVARVEGDAVGGPGAAPTAGAAPIARPAQAADAADTTRAAGAEVPAADAEAGETDVIGGVV